LGSARQRNALSGGRLLQLPAVSEALGFESLPAGQPNNLLANSSTTD